MTGAEFRRMRQRAGFTQKILSKRLGIRAFTISKMENDRIPVRPLVEYAVKYLVVERCLGIPVPEVA